MKPRVIPDVPILRAVRRGGRRGHEPHLGPVGFTKGRPRPSYARDLEAELWTPALRDLWHPSTQGWTGIEADNRPGCRSTTPVFDYRPDQPGMRRHLPCADGAHLADSGRTV